MHFRIDDTFLDSLARLANDEQKAVKTSVFDLVSKRRGRGLRLKKLRDGSWSARVNHDMRIIADWNERENHLRLRYVGHHDEAYQWAERHKTKARAENDATEEATASQSAPKTAPPVPATQQKKSIRLGLLAFAEKTVDICLVPLSALRSAIANARNGQREPGEPFPDANERAAKGAAEVRKLYEISNVGTVAGCYVLEGKIACDDQIRIIRGGMAIHEGKVDSLKHRKKNVQEIQRGYECGIGIWNYPNIRVGDRIESY